MVKIRECRYTDKHIGNEYVTDKRLENALKARAGIIEEIKKLLEPLKIQCFQGFLYINRKDLVIGTYERKPVFLR